MKIEKNSQGGVTTIRLIGRFQTEHASELKEQLRCSSQSVVLDLTEVTLVDADFVRFLGSCEVGGVRLVNCSPYIREWIRQERKE